MYQAVRFRSQFGTCWTTDDQRDQLDRQEQRGGDQEDAGGVVRLVAGRADDEQLGERDARTQDDECEPVTARRREIGEQR